MKWVTDNNGNRCSIEFWGSETKAHKALSSLQNCSDCSNCANCANCANCSNCSDCSNCANCANCSNCSSCHYCVNCANCSNCHYCVNCANCSNCSSCHYCVNCANCSSCHYCVNCSEQPTANLITNRYPVCFRKNNTLRIGCQDHDLSNWLAFPDKVIKKMDGEQALLWWRQWKPVIETIAEQQLPH